MGFEPCRGVAAGGFWADWREVSLALLAALAHFHANVGDEEHAEEAPGDDLECRTHEYSPSGDNRTLFLSADLRPNRSLTVAKRPGPIKAALDGHRRRSKLSLPVAPFNFC